MYHESYRCSKPVYEDIILYESLASENICSVRSVGIYITALRLHDYLHQKVKEAERRMQATPPLR